ncbi:MAG: hypothetical protein AAGH64_03250 [Planctomycetota bacterium]
MTGRRRTKYALMTAALLATITGVSGIAVVLGDAYSLRLDATATRDHSLDERTERLIAGLGAEHELVLSADLSRLSRAAGGALADLIDALDRTENLRVTVIDSRATLADLIRRLAERDAAEVAAHRGAIASARGGIDTAVEDALELASRLRAFDPENASARANLDAGAAALERGASELRDLAERFDAFASGAYAGAELPEADAALDGLDPAGARLIAGLNTIESELATTRRSAAASMDDEAASWAGGAQAIAERVRSALRGADDALRALGPLEPLRIARAIERQELILLIGPERTTALDVRTLVPAIGATGADAVRLVREGEQTLATALASAAVEDPPIVVLVHAAQQRLLDDEGRPVPQLEQAFGGLSRRLAQRSIDLAEWAVSAGQAMPTRAALDPTGRRPIVWMTAGVPAPGSRDRYRRLVDFGTGVSRLAANGESLLLTLAPSDAVSLGETDPLANVARQFGLEVRTETPLITSTDGGVFRGQDVRETLPGSALSASVEGLPLLLLMPSPIDVVDPAPAGVEASPLLVAPDNPGTWGESEWFGIVYARGASPPAPTRDAGTDVLDGPFVVGATASRVRTVVEPSPTIDRSQRVVVVTGSDEWYATGVLTGEQEIDGVRSLQFPGNSALLDASISYLAGLDEMLAREARDADVARIGALTDREALTLRLLLVAGLPVGVLVLGGVWRLVRR